MLLWYQKLPQALVGKGLHFKKAMNKKETFFFHWPVHDLSFQLIYPDVITIAWVKNALAKESQIGKLPKSDDPTGKYKVL